ncbi:MAG TPA: HipA N-terminal domain-containing protein [Gemmatimonadaceae bacterium]|nr:HipA N-terminal domain-containing protein [Gemmatimonadaceae bacterium]
MLSVLLDGRVAGNVYRLAGGRLRFIYDDRWRLDPEAYPVSWSMPLAAAEHDHDRIHAYLWGLLPDNQRTLDAYARRFNVSARSPVDLLAHMGADCAGAIQLVPPDSVSQFLGAPPARPLVQWLSEREVATELREVRTSGISGGAAGAMGQFSLAGTQPKLALLEANGSMTKPL